MASSGLRGRLGLSKKPALTPNVPSTSMAISQNRTNIADAIIIAEDLQIIDLRSDRPPTEQHFADCVLRKNGELALIHKATGSRMTFQINGLPASAIQHLDASVAGLSDFAIAIYPSFAQDDSVSSHLQPVALCPTQRETSERWMSLLKRIAQIEMYQPRAGDVASNFRNRLTAKISKITFCLEIRASHVQRKLAELSPRSKGPLPEERSIEFRVDLLVDNHVFTQTQWKTFDNEAVMTPMKWSETLDVEDLPTAASAVSLRLVGRRVNASRPGTSDTVPPPLRRPVTFGEAHLSSNYTNADIERQLRTQLVSGNDDSGWISATYKRTNMAILGLNGYRDMLEVLDRGSGSITTTLYQRIQPEEAKRITLHLLDVFQARNLAIPWLKALIKDEVDLLRSKIEPQTDPGTPGTAPQSSESLSTLFRGTTLLTRSLDEYMKRIGYKYLENTLGSILRTIIEEDVHCEIDPHKVGPDDIPDAMIYLKGKAEAIWNAIDKSSFHCPPEMCKIFKYARQCALEAFKTSSTYWSSITAFLFLRFFNSAINTPYLWGLVRTPPPPHVARTFLLLSKVILAIANMSTLDRIPYMVPFNGFVVFAHNRLRLFLGSICEAANYNRPPVPVVVPLDLCRSLAELARWWSGIIAAHRVGRPVDAGTIPLRALLDQGSPDFVPVLIPWTNACKMVVVEGKRMVGEEVGWREERREERREGRIVEREAVEGRERECEEFWGEGGGAGGAQGKGKKPKKEREVLNDDPMYHLERKIGLI